MCDDCLGKIGLTTEQRCPICEQRIAPQGNTCLRCRTHSSIDGLLVATSYQEPTVSLAIHYFKYRFIDALHVPLGKMLIRAIENSTMPLPDLIIPIPLHPRRLRWRGFNQAALLARYLAENLTPGFPLPVLEKVLIRRRYTNPQMQLKNHTHRKKNIRGAFAIEASSRRLRKSLRNKNVWLIDDVTTTGATLFECAETLKKAGVRSVFGIVLARQEFKKK